MVHGSVNSSAPVSSCNLSSISRPEGPEGQDALDEASFDRQEYAKVVLDQLALRTLTTSQIELRRYKPSCAE